MNLTNEQIQRILNGAPDGATHYQSTTYLRYDSNSWVWWSEVENDWCFVRDESLGWAQLLGGHHGSLSDLNEILTLRQEVGRLKVEVESVNHDIIEAVKKARTQWAREDVASIKKRESEVAAQAVEDAVKKYKLPSFAGPDIFSDGLLDYANQLRKGEDDD